MSLQQTIIDAVAVAFNALDDLPETVAVTHYTGAKTRVDGVTTPAIAGGFPKNVQGVVVDWSKDRNPPATLQSGDIRLLIQVSALADVFPGDLITVRGDVFTVYKPINVGQVVWDLHLRRGN